MTKLELTIKDIKVTWEISSEECDANQLIEAFYGLLVSHTWLPETITRSMKEFAEERDE